ncbi:hypothetical protein KEM55_006743 [Ascosphaera atra]|nr:hypothetical protein KEM55_006743 [Ascosphaera atra]
MPSLNPFANSSPPSPTLLPIASTSTSSSSQKPNHTRARSAPALSLDLSAIRGFGTPFSYNASPPTNTLLLTALDDLRLFQPSTLDAMKQALSELAPLNSFSPLPSFRRIVVSFREVDEAVKARTYLEIKGLRTKPKATGPDESPAAPSSMLKETGAIFPRIYFGEFTPIVSEDNSKSFLDLPPANKLFFISPPPSPPAGWQMKTEDPPNKEVVATDLAAALHKLGGGSKEDEPEQQQTDLTPTSSSSSIAVDANAG